MALFLSVPASAQGVSDEPIPPELQPYRVRISVAFDSDPLLTARFRGDVLTSIEQAAQRVFGQVWTLHVKENRWLFPANRVGLGRLSYAGVRQRLGEADDDKMFLLVIRRSGPRYELAGREWDAALQDVSPLQTRAIYDRHALGEEALRLIGSLFRPILTVHHVDPAEPDRVQLRLRAGAFPVHDPDAAQLRKGDILQPFFRYRDRDGAIQRIETLPWTYLVVDANDSGRVSDLGRVTCSLVSGFRAPLGTGSLRRVEQMAVRIRGTVDTTQLQLVSRGASSAPLVGYRVEAVPKTFIRDKAQGKTLELVTDRRGRIRIPYRAEQPVTWLYVRSGDALLARVPFAAGIRAQVAFQLPNDALRLATEGELDLLKGRLVDVVARRATLAARMRSLARKGDWDTVTELREALTKLPGVDRFESQLTAIRVPALDAAKAQGDRVAEAKILRLCNNASELIKRYLDEDKLRVVLEEIDELRRVQQPARKSGERRAKSPER